MLVELKPKLQVIIPRRIAEDMDLKTGDKFEVVAEDGIIKFIPVVVYQKKEAERLEKLANEAREARRRQEEGTADTSTQEPAVSAPEPEAPTAFSAGDPDASEAFARRVGYSSL